MKKFILLTALALTVSACSSCAKKDQTPVVVDPPPCASGSCSIPQPPVPPPVDNSDVMAKDNWQFTVTGPGWTSVAPPDPVVQILLKNDAQHLMVFLVKEATQYNLSAYTLGTIRAMRASNGVTIQSAKVVTINDNQFALVTAKNDSNTVFVWLGVKDKFGYTFSCGGPTNVDAGIDPCQKIADTLQIK